MDQVKKLWGLLKTINFVVSNTHTIMSQNIDYSALLSCFLPEGILDYFIVTRYEFTSVSFSIWLEEKIDIPEEFKGLKVHSNGFFNEITVQDFPVRGRKVSLIVKRRRWEVQDDTHRSVCRDWDLVAKGTRITKDLASFLKDLSGY